MFLLSDASTPATPPLSSSPVETRSEEPSVTREASLNNAESSKSSLGKNSSTVQLSSATTSSSAPDVPIEGTIIRVATAPNIKKVYRKIDKRILLWYCLIFAVLKIAERKISNAAIINLEQGTGIKKQLGNLSSSQWAWIMSIFSYPYIALDACSVMLTKKFTPRIWLGRIMVTWGVISMCQAATKSYAGLLICRFFLGVAEAGFAPAAFFHISFWFPADHLPLRVAILSATSIFSGAFSGLFGFAISFLNGLGGLPGWRYLFLLEGAPAVVVGVITCFTLPNYPENAKFLDQAERDLVQSLMPENQPTGSSKNWDLSEVKALLRDPVTYGFCLIWVCQTMGGCGVGIVLPQVVYELGLRNTALTQLLTVPAVAVMLVFVLFFGWNVHKKRLDPWKTALVLNVLCLSCYVALFVVTNPWVRYAFLIVAGAPAVAVLQILLPERVRTAHGTTSTALAIGITSSCSSLHGIVGPHLYASKYGPAYRISYGIAIGLLVLAIVAVFVTWRLVKRRQTQESNAESTQGTNKKETSVEVVEMDEAGACIV